jgi:hypothetical protein
MITVFVIPLILAFSPAAVWALRAGGLRLLWSLCAFTLAAVVLVALFLSAVYSVPSVWLLILYFLGFVGPPMVFATGSLTLASGFARTLPLQLVTALAGSIIGLGVGIVVVVYVLGVWLNWVGRWGKVELSGKDPTFTAPVHLSKLHRLILRDCGSEGVARKDLPDRNSGSPSASLSSQA